MKGRTQNADARTAVQRVVVKEKIEVEVETRGRNVGGMHGHRVSCSMRAAQSTHTVLWPVVSSTVRNREDNRVT